MSQFEIWAADLNSLYDDEGPWPPVMVEVVDNEILAQGKVAEIQDHATASWYQESL